MIGTSLIKHLLLQSCLIYWLEEYKCDVVEHAGSGILGIRFSKQKNETGIPHITRAKLVNAGCVWDGATAAGTEALKNELNFVVSIQSRDSPGINICSGVLATWKHVLTAAHCLKSRLASDLQVAVGISDVGTDTSPRNLFGVACIRPHESYDERFGNDDIALIELSREIQDDIKKVAERIAMPMEIDPEVGSSLFMAGWGTLEKSKAASTRIMKAQVPVIDSPVCSEDLDHPIESTKMCTGRQTEVRWQGDDGAPLFRRTCEKQFVLVGLTTSFSSKEGKTYNVFTRVSKYFPWLLKEAKDKNGKTCSDFPQGFVPEIASVQSSE